ncbi:peptidoglycan-binding protein [Phormidium sp. LEGE 05292]|uniref:peptidoglycan-binding domain-containing protein n=1 Tax=[Phormidium] sp. LEGE 05292 TaxID=767427 RepID=UPI001881941F|nr:peptidoglycan-binding domain-containing protein [Phormidium sp. LEGE 05292]MBE9223886.1 peptidoglycan-binding protein [Phormidium sp. LEGE 05292]
MQTTNETTTINISLPVLKIGTSGEAVRFLQQVLIALGYQISFDAVFGTETQKVVKNFQAEGDLADDGIVGPKTWRALGEAILKLTCC